jgi:hypothetical protein
LEDKKDQAKLQRGLQDSLYKLNQADRLEKFGMLKEAAALKHEASQFDQGMIKLQHEAVQNRLRDDAAERRTKIMAGASITGDVIRSQTAEKDGSRSEATVRGQTLQSLGQEAKIYAADASDVLSTPAARKIAQGNLDATMKEMKRVRAGGVAEPKSDYDIWKATKEQ